MEPKTPMNRQRWIVHYSGRVQGVGFRYTARTLAEQFDVSGYVQNLPDGRVRLEVEGDAAEIERFLQRLQQRMAGYIRDRKVDVQPARGDYDGFQIRF